jgi:hypothetical protein
LPQYLVYEDTVSNTARMIFDYGSCQATDLLNVKLCHVGMIFLAYVSSNVFETTGVPGVQLQGRRARISA